mmetsp:Transcript_154792/g.288568  ORF Transcript_154792/g.288568 Transcript_154792/m.288568 type:complete len:150 (+) Transcript_154792:2201-2650(+)
MRSSFGHDCSYSPKIGRMSVPDPHSSQVDLEARTLCSSDAQSGSLKPAELAAIQAKIAPHMINTRTSAPTHLACSRPLENGSEVLDRTLCMSDLVCPTSSLGDKSALAEHLGDTTVPFPVVSALNAGYGIAESSSAAQAVCFAGDPSAV